MYILQGIRIDGFSKSLGRLRKRHVTVRIDEGESWTSPKLKLNIKEDALVWDELKDRKLFDALPTSTLQLALFETPIVGEKSEEVGRLTRSIASLLDCPQGPLEAKTQKSRLNVTIILLIDERPVLQNDSENEDPQLVSKQGPELTKVISEAQAALSSMHRAREVPGLDTSAKLLESVSKKFKDGTDAWQPLVDKLEGFMTLMDGIAEIHPYATLAWSVISAAYKIYKSAKDRDEKVDDLAEAMTRAYDTVMAGTTLKKLMCRSGQPQVEEIRQADQRHTDVLQHLSIQTVECGQFIAKYAKDRSFFMRAGKQILGSPKIIIERFIETFQKLQQAFEQQAVVNTEIMVVRVLRTAQKIEMTTDLTGLTSVYVKGAGYNTSKQCLAGTRTAVLDQLSEWVNCIEDNTPKVRLLFGQAGSGKSTIAHTVASRFRAMKRLGAAFCFTSSSAQHSKHAFATIALDLASFDASFKATLWKGVGEDLADQTTHDLERQFETFILKPSQEVAFVGSVLILFDGLDEIGDVRARAPLLRVLAEYLQKLPSGFRVLLTARPEPDIVSFFNEPASGYAIQHLNTSPNDQLLKNDILLFVRTELTKVRPRIEDLDESNYLRMAEISEGLFQWARVACDYVAGDGRLRKRPKKRYEELLRNSEHSQKPGTGVNLLDNLYLLVLSGLLAIEEDEAELLELFKMAMGLVLYLFAPLTMDALEALARHVNGRVPDDMGYLLPYLGSFLSGVTERKSAVRPLHSSFRDFLSSRSRAKAFYIGNASIHHDNLALASLRILNSELHFNMCNLETSYRLNRDVPDLNKRIDQYISSDLSYASRFWAQHINSQSDLKTSLMTSVQTLLDTNFLFWVEVLSLLGVVNSAAWGLSTVIPIIEACDSGLAALARDALRFVRNLARPIADSAPHIYVSAFVNSPRCSIVYAHHHEKYPKLVQICKGRWARWPELLNTLRGHRDAVSGVTFSPDGKQIVSSSFDGSLRLWDTETGEPSGTPLEGHSGPVNSVSYSLGGNLIVSGSQDKTVRIWDARTREAIGTPLVGHRRSVQSVAISQDGRRIVSGSDDKTIRIWHLETAGPVATSLRGHRDAVRSVDLSPDGKRVVSGSDDGTIRIWDVETGRLVGAPMVGSREVLRYLLASSDFAHSNSDGTDSDCSSSDGGDSQDSNSDGGVSAGSEEDASGWSSNYYMACEVQSVAFSPDGTRIVSGSEDQNGIRIWDIETGELVSQASGYVDCVAFSPDGQWIVSGGGDGIVRIWNAETAQPVSTLVDGHRDMSIIRSVAFSPDGKRILSGSADNTIRVWNAEPDNPVDIPADEHISGGITCVAFSPDGKRIVSISYDTAIQMWDAETGQALCSPAKRDDDFFVCAAFSPNGMRLVSGGDDGSLQLWNVVTGTTIGGALKGHIDSVCSLQFSPDGMQIISGSADGILRLWDARTGRRLVTWRVAQRQSFDRDSDPIGVKSVAYSPDGKRIVSGSSDGIIRIWNSKTAELVGSPLEGHGDSVNCVTFSPDGMRIISASDDRSVRIWDAESRQLVGVPLKGHNGGVGTVAISPDGKLIVSGSDDTTIRIWDVDTGQRLGALLDAHTNPVTCVAFSPDGKWIVSGSEDSTIRIWDVELLRPQAASPTHQNNLVACVAEHDGDGIPSFLKAGSVTLSNQEDPVSDNEPDRNDDHHFVWAYVSTDFSPLQVRCDLNTGWITCNESDYLFWLPPEQLKNLCTTGCQLVIPSSDMVTLDMSQFAHGERWAECHQSIP